MKKIVCILVLTCVVMGGAFAQSNTAAPIASDAQNSVAMDVFRLFDGLTSFDSNDKENFIGTTLSFSYERSIVPHWSIGPNIDVGLGGYLGYFRFNLGIAAEGRYYPFASFDKFFLGATLGFNISAGIYSGSRWVYNYITDEWEIDTSPSYFKNTSTFGLDLGIKAGYKLVTSKKFYLEPALSYGMSGFGGHLRLGITF